MINFFRKIRKQLADDNKPIKYFRYAIGEILLVVIGILIALSINNWNEQRKDHLKVNKLFENLESSLKTDSIALIDIISRSDKAVSNMKIILDNTAPQLREQYSDSDIRTMARAVFEGVYSFYPKMGVYNQIMSSNLMSLIQSNDIKDALRLYYDFRCTRYRTLDPLMDTKFHINYQSFLAEKLQITHNTHFDTVDYQKAYVIKDIEALQTEVKKLYDLSFGVHGIVKEMKQDIDNLLILITSELAND